MKPASLKSCSCLRASSQPANRLSPLMKPFILLLVCTCSALAAQPYDPTKPTSPVAHPIDLTIEAQDGAIPLRIILPKAAAPAPVILFSHGLGGTNKGYSYLGQAWAARGYAVVFLQHPGSDDEVWRGSKDPMSSLRKAANPSNFMQRLRDVRLAIDQLATWTSQIGHPLFSKLDLSRLGMSGHSFGALTTQAVGGQTLPWVGTRFTDPRIKAAVCLSPSAPRRRNLAKDFSTVKIPWLLITGTNDISSIGSQNLSTRLAVFESLPPEGKYELVLNGADHMAFGDFPVPRSSANPNHHKAISAISSAFWDAFLLDNKDARTWLDGEGAETILTAADTLRKK